MTSTAPDARAQLRDAGKLDDLVVLGEQPLVAETLPSLLDDDTTPIEAFYVRNNGALPPPADWGAWHLRIDGEVERPLDLTLEELRSLGEVTRFLVLECAGNGRSAFSPQANGNQWTHGGVGCAAWTGVPLARVLERAGLRPTARHTAHFGSDEALSRGIPIEKALDPSTLLVWGMNGEALPRVHGGPLRLIVPGWAGSASQKWLTRITLRDREHDGPGMTGLSYKIPTRPISPDEPVDPATFRTLEALPVRAVITHPVDGAILPAGSRSLALRGRAWAGAHLVRLVEVSIDGGATWHPAELEAPRNDYDWQRWSVSVPVGDSSYEVLARGTDASGATQPFEPAWNPQGYAGNAMHRVAVRVG